MKKVTTVCLSTFILGSLGMTSQAFAEDGGSYTSNGIVEFTPSEERQLIRLTQRIQLIQLILLTQQILKVLIQEQTVRCQLIMRQV